MSGNAGTSPPQADSSWTLFLDRDGVLNRKIDGGYVLGPSMLEILPGVPQAVASLAKRFGIIVIVTNQRGIGRGLMTRDDLERIHHSMQEAIVREGGRIDAIFACTHDLGDGCECRKPRTGLALMAKAQMPSIDFARSFLVGDSDSDIALGKALGMHTVRIGPPCSVLGEPWTFPNLLEFAKFVA